MKVALYVPGLRPEMGGGHTYEQEIARAVAERRDATPHEILAAGHARHPPDGWDEASYLHLRINPSNRAIGRVQRTLGLPVARGRGRPLRSFDSVFQSNGIDLVWCVVPGAPTLVLPYVTTIWDLQHRMQPIFPEVASKDEWFERERFFSLEIGQAAAVIVGTAAGQAEVERFYGVPAERIWRLPHPTPSFALGPPETSDDALARFGLESGYVLYPAQFWAHKNHVGLLHALRLLRDDHGVQLQAVFVGSDRGNEAHVRRVARSLGLSGQVHHLGFVPRSDLVTLYRQAFALAYVTFFGPENLPPLEAFALGCPVVASDVPGAHEQLGDAALLAPPANPSLIAEALLTLHRDDALRSSLVARGRERAQKRSAGDFAAGIFAIIDELEPMVRTWR